MILLDTFDKTYSSLTHCELYYNNVNCTQLKHLYLLLFWLQIVGDIATVLPPYTIDVLQEKHNRLGYRQEMFGSHVDFVPLDQNNIVFPDVSQLCDIILMNENIQNEDLLIGEVEDNTVNNIHELEEQKFSGKSV